jgi:hypothetical protein
MLAEEEDQGGESMNLVVGDYIEFTLAQFEGGSFSRFGRRGQGATYVGDKSFEGTIERDWYDCNQRHWFSIRLADGKLKRAQGKNLYPGITEHRHGEQHDNAAKDKVLRKEVAR